MGSDGVLDLPGAMPDDAGMTTWFGAPDAREAVVPALGEGAAAFHRSLPGYAPTPLIDLPALAAALGIRRLVLKDESWRLGLPAFKILGASWACRQVHERDPHADFVAATDGNHGRAVARTAAQLGVGATVFVPAVMLPATAAAIAGEGATVIRVDGDYDTTVRRAAAYAAAAPGRALIQDTAWQGYTEVPAWIVDGYRTVLEEVDTALAVEGGVADLVVVPVGVGSLAETVVRHYRQPAGPRPRVLSVEPASAACLLASLSAGRPVTVPTAATVMAGLNCPTVSASAWPVLHAGLDAAVAVEDGDARSAAEDLAALGVPVGPCGAATLAGLRAVAGHPARSAALDLGPSSVAVLLNTEGQQT